MYPYGIFPGGAPLVSIVGLAPSSSFLSGTGFFGSALGKALPDDEVDKSDLLDDSALNSGFTLIVGAEVLELE